MRHQSGQPTRRQFLGAAASCAAHIALLAQAAPAAARTLWQPRSQRKVVAEEPWGRIEQITDGVWALVSTPLQDRKTFSNGAIIAGRERVLVVEAFGSNDGAKWLAGWAQKLTNRPVDDVVITHYHGDHSAGIGGFGPEAERKAARLRATPQTIQLVRADDQQPPAPPTNAAHPPRKQQKISSCPQPSASGLCSPRATSRPRSAHGRKS